jgi:LacI family transcriptional regulator
VTPTENHTARVHRINLQDLADQLGVARSTVSRALRDDPLIAVETRRRVKEAAEKLGYRSNPYVSVLMSRLREGATPTGSPVVAFLNPQTSRDSWRDSKPMVTAIQGAAERAKELGFELQEFWFGEPGMTSERLTEVLLARGIRALILGAPGQLGEHTAFPTEGFAAVAIDLEPAREHLHRATSDYLGNTTRILQAMRRMGYRRIGLAITRNILELLHHQPRMAFLDFEETLPQADRTGYWLGDLTDVVSFARWIADARPDGIVTMNVYPQVWLQSLGLRIPQDIGVAQLEPEIVKFPLTGIDGRFEIVGRNAMDLLITQIHRNQFTPPTGAMHVTNPGVWRPGASTRDLTSSRGPSPYDEIRVGICEAAAANDAARLHANRQQYAQRFYHDPFGLAQAASSGAWRTLPLGSVANTAFQTPPLPPTFAERGLFGFTAGRRLLHGVPFEIPAPSLSGAPTVLSVTHEEVRGQRRVPSVTRRVSVDATVRAIYSLHAALFVWSSAAVGHYRFVYADGRTHTIDLVPYWPPIHDASVAAVQDAWAALPQFASETAKALFVPSAAQPFAADWFFYVAELRNPRPEAIVQAIEVVPSQESRANLIVAGLTALLAQ